MNELSVHALCAAQPRVPVAVRTAGELPPGAPAGDLALLAARARGVPVAELRLLAADTDPDADVALLALEALAAVAGPADDEPLFLVRSGPLRDQRVAELGRIVHATGWRGDDLGVTHLDELGGVLIAGLLGWAVETRATVLVPDDPPLLAADALAPPRAVALRFRRGPGPLRVLGCAEGAPPGDAGIRFTGAGPCDAWLSLAAALDEGTVPPGERLLLHTVGAHREGWLALAAVDPGAVAVARSTGAPGDTS
ncbi:hypothetical protein [Streptomyces sp. NBRC 109706]|uniref:hypothetical protein n=1 Tax=Streptomyces sp. NBRC 109706 TaxID=1550035 RepID=UPI000785051A|nr:hypothetical protein [Streptomyces sp. NBRC 109706]